MDRKWSLVLICAIALVMAGCTESNTSRSSDVGPGSAASQAPRVSSTTSGSTARTTIRTVTPPASVAAPACPDDLPAPWSANGSGPETGTLEIPSGHLLPDATPLAATVCRYDFVRFGAPAKVTRADLMGDFSGLRKFYTLRQPLPPTACTAQQTSNSSEYLLQLRYPRGTAWVLTSYDCPISSFNGFGAFEAIDQRELAAALHTRHWPAS